MDTSKTYNPKGAEPQASYQDDFRDASRLQNVYNKSHRRTVETDSFDGNRKSIRTGRPISRGEDNQVPISDLLFENSADSNIESFEVHDEGKRKTDTSFGSYIRGIRPLDDVEFISPANISDRIKQHDFENNNFENDLSIKYLPILSNDVNFLDVPASPGVVPVLAGSSSAKSTTTGLSLLGFAAPAAAVPTCFILSVWFIRFIKSLRKIPKGDSIGYREVPSSQNELYNSKGQDDLGKNYSQMSSDDMLVCSPYPSPAEGGTKTIPLGDNKKDHDSFDSGIVPTVPETAVSDAVGVSSKDFPKNQNNNIKEPDKNLTNGRQGALNIDSSGGTVPLSMASVTPTLLSEYQKWGSQIHPRKLSEDSGIGKITNLKWKLLPLRLQHAQTGSSTFTTLAFVTSIFLFVLCQTTTASSGSGSMHKGHQRFFNSQTWQIISLPVSYLCLGIGGYFDMSVTRSKFLRYSRRGTRVSALPHFIFWFLVVCVLICRLSSDFITLTSPTCPIEDSSCYKWPLVFLGTDLSFLTLLVVPAGFACVFFLSATQMCYRSTSWFMLFGSNSKRDRLKKFNTATSGEVPLLEDGSFNNNNIFESGVINNQYLVHSSSSSSLSHYKASPFPVPKKKSCISLPLMTNRALPPETFVSLFSLLSFAWIFPILRMGRKDTLTEPKIPHLHPTDTPAFLTNNMACIWNTRLKNWKKRTEDPKSSKRSIKKPSMGSTLFKFCCPMLIHAGGLKLVYDCLVLLGPILLNRIVTFLEKSVSTTDKKPPLSEGLVFVACMFISSALQTVFLHQYFQKQYRLGLRLRMALMSLLYEKAVTRRVQGVDASKVDVYDPNATTNKTDKDVNSTGRIVNLMGVDCNRIQDTMTYIHILWSAPFQIIVSTYLIYRVIGFSVFAGVGVMVLTMPLTNRISKRLRKIQKQLMGIKDNRLKKTSEILSNIKTIKMYAWEDSFRDEVIGVRSAELTCLWKYQLTSLVSKLTWNGAPLVVSWAAFLAYSVIAGHELTPAVAFTALALFNILRFPLQVLPNLINNLAEAKVALTRIELFLDSPDSLYRPALPADPSGLFVKVDDLCLSWRSDSTDTDFLRNVSFAIRRGEVVAVVGLTGCGKSGLLSGLLGDVEITSGQLSMNGTMAYCAQTPWIQNATVRENILFGQPYEPEFYAAVRDACCLTADFEVFPNGDDTEIGERGVNLSGGQKQRVALARALYQKPNVALLDDVLSAVDVEVGYHIFHHAIKKILKQSATLLVTHKIEILNECTNILFLHNQTGLFFGPPEDLWNVPEFKQFTETLSKMEKTEEDKEQTHELPIIHTDEIDELFDPQSPLSAPITPTARRRANTEMIYSTPQLFHSPPPSPRTVQHRRTPFEPAGSFDAFVGHNSHPRSVQGSLLDELWKPEVEKDNIVTRERVYSEIATPCDPEANLCIEEMAGEALQESTLHELKEEEQGLTHASGHRARVESETNKTTDSTADHQGKPSQDRRGSKRLMVEYGSKTRSRKTKTKIAGDEVPQALIEAEYLQAGKVGFAVYQKYFRHCGGALMCSLVVFGIVAGQGSQVIANFWLSFWSSHSESNPPSVYISSALGLGVYAGTGLVGLVVLTAGVFFLALAGQRAAKAFHDLLLIRIMRGQMSFFESTPIGRIVNRFTRDLYTIDESFPNTLYGYITQIVLTFQTLLVIVIVTPWFATVIFALGILYVVVFKLYIPTSRQLQRIDSVLRSPIFSHFTETLDGAPTIRAFEQQIRFREIHFFRLTANSRAYFLYVSANRWLATRLEFIGSVVVAGAALLSVAGRDTVSAALGGLAISYALNVTQTLNWLVRISGDLESNVVSIERAVEYIYGDACPEEAAEIVSANRPPLNWPSFGEVRFENVEMRYRPHLEPALRGISFVIHPGEKVGVAGRTGAGKSSVLLSLLRIVEPSGGSIYIDGVDVLKMGLKDLRRNVAIIPQDPFLFSATLRRNLDPFDEYTDEQIWTSLDRSCLSETVMDLPGQLNFQLSEEGKNFSLGQRQLVCLARVLLKNVRVLLLDEATSAVDPVTDAFIQKTIRTHFTNTTVITIAHRIHTILDYDRIIVMAGGKIAGFNSAAELLAEKNPIFTQFINQMAQDDSSQSPKTETEKLIQSGNK